MAVWLVTGGSGFIGRHVLDALASRTGDRPEVASIGRSEPERPTSVTHHRCDLDDPSTVRRFAATIRPDVVLHLAARTPPADPRAMFRTNTGATATLLDALEALGRPCRFVHAGSIAEHGPIPSESLPAGASTPCRPADSYALSKWCASNLTRFQRRWVEGIVARIANPIGPGMSRRQAFGRFAAALASGRGPLRLGVGDLSARRDFVDVRDVAEALIGLGERGVPASIYHVGTGRSRTVAEGLETLALLSGRELDLHVDDSCLGRALPRDSRVDLGPILPDTGWMPRISFESSLRDLWDEAVADSGGGRPPLVLPREAREASVRPEGRAG